MDEQDTVALDLPRRGRHRLPASSLRRAVRRLSLGAGAVALVIGLAVLAAVATGLTGAPWDLGSAPAPLPPSESTAYPISARAGGVGARPTAEATPASDADATDAAPDVVAEQPDPVPVGYASPPAADPAPAGEAKSPAVSTVRPGDPCLSEGSAGITDGGKQTVCIRRGDGRARWRVS